MQHGRMSIAGYLPENQTIYTSDCLGVINWQVFVFDRFIQLTDSLSAIDII